MIRPILAQENITDSTKKLKRLIYNNKKIIRCLRSNDFLLFHQQNN